MKKSANLAAENFLSLLFSMAVVLGTNHTLLGQVSEGGIPYSFSNLIPANIHTITMGPVNVDSLLAEDEAEAKQGIPVPSLPKEPGNFIFPKWFTLIGISLVLLARAHSTKFWDSATRVRVILMLTAPRVHRGLMRRGRLL